MTSERNPHAVASDLPARREFMHRMAQGGAALLGSAMLPQLPGSPQNLRASKRTLEPQDFQYLGYFDISLSGEFSYGMGLTRRFVDNEWRFLALSHVPVGGAFSYELVEFREPALGETINWTRNRWPNVWLGQRGGAGGQFHGLFWDPQVERLLTTAGIDYPDDSQIMSCLSLASSQLGSGGQVLNVRGLWGLDGVGARCVYGGVARVPQWFRDAYQVGPYVIGFGGYASRMSQGLPVSMGLALYAIPDPHGLADNSLFSRQQYRVLADHTSGTTGGAWYPGSSKPSASDRGHRGVPVTNDYDSWKSPAPDGFGRWTWGDSAYQTGVWIDRPDKHGFVIIPTLHTGRTWYQNSTLNYHGRTAEIQVFDPGHFGEVIKGQREPWRVQPTAMWQPPQFPTGGVGVGNGPLVSGATYDEVSRRLYVRSNFYGGSWPYTTDRVFVWQIA